MGTVYLAQDQRFQRRFVAIKENLDSTPESRTQFRLEAELLATLRHPSLPNVTDHFVTPEGRQFLVMEYVEGQTLTERVERDGPIPEARALTWATQVLDALAYLHGQTPAIIHRDVKPDNVRITPEGDAVLVDFGVAKYMIPDEKTATVARAGSPGYAPPEQYAGGTDARTDLYAVGGLLYFALTGQAPLESPLRTTGQKMSAPRALNRGVPRRTDRLILRAMAIQPAQRFQSADAMKTVIAQNGTTSLQTLSQQTTLKILATAVVVVMLGLGGYIGWSMFGGDDTDGRRSSSPTTTVANSTTTATPQVAVGKTETVTPPPSSTPEPTDTVPAGAATSTPTQTPTPTHTASPTPTHTPTYTPTPVGPQLGDIWIRPADQASMVYVRGGIVSLGSSSEQIAFAMELCKSYGIDCDREIFTDEEPLHTVKLTRFWFDKMEVTNEQYSLCVADGECAPPADYSSYGYSSYYNNPTYANYPVIHVNWYQANNYCQWAGARLPTEAEWEYAAEGPQAWLFPWGNSFDSGRLNYCDRNCDFDWRDNSVNDGYRDTAPVGTYPNDASWCGAHDLGGNVWEWVEDPYLYYLSSRAPKPGRRVLRGGTWHLGPDSARCANRDHHTPDTTHVSVGFRCAKDH